MLSALEVAVLVRLLRECLVAERAAVGAEVVVSADVRLQGEQVLEFLSAVPKLAEKHLLQPGTLPITPLESELVVLGAAEALHDHPLLVVGQVWTQEILVVRGLYVQ